jgi:hypothetical protein
MSDPTTILAEHQARRLARDTARTEFDAAALPLLRRFVAASFREHPGLRALAFAAYQDYDSSRLTSKVYVDNPRLSDDAWGRAGFPGECPTNELDPDELDLIADRLGEFSPSLQRTHGMGWCVAFWRDPTAEDGVATEQREHPGFD